MSPKSLFNKIEKEEIIAAIKEAELNTSGEIRVHIETQCQDSPIKRAIEVFKDLKMNETKLQNGVLIYFASKDKKLAIIGDKGINDQTPEDYWEINTNNIISSIKAGEMCKGLCTAIHNIGLKLKKIFPYQKDDVNELSDDISFFDNEKKEKQ